MNDHKLLEELRAQRETIRKHLEWLEEKIKTLEDQGGRRASQTAEASIQPQDSSSVSAIEVAESNEPESEQDEELDQKIGQYKAPTANEIQRAKVGCLVLFVLGSLLFLFLLFGLPYLID